MSISSALKAIIAEKHLSLSAFAREVGVTPSCVKSWIDGRTTPKGPSIARISERFNVPPSLILGSGATDGLPTSLKLADGTVAIPKFSATGSCGGGAINDNVQMVNLIYVAADWLRMKCPTVQTRSLEVITADGDSMSPTINNLDFLFIDRSVKTVTSDGIYAVIFNGEVFIKRVQKQIDGGLLLISDNPKYPPMRVAPDQMASVFIAGRCCIHCSAKEI